MDTLVTVSTILAVASVTECVLWMVLAIRAAREWRCALFIADALRLPAIPLPLLTVVIPAHNEELMAPNCARSVLASDYPALELIFVLDRCTDGTRAALEPIAAADSRLRIVVHSWNGKWIVEFEAASYKQAIKIDQEAVKTIEAVKALLNEEFLTEIENQFQNLHKAWSINFQKTNP